MTVPAYDITLSSTIMHAAATLQPFATSDTVLPAETAKSLVIELSLALKLASSLEQELAVHRLGEAAGKAGHIIETESTTCLDQLVRDPAGTVVRINFDGRRKP